MGRVLLKRPIGSSVVYRIFCFTNYHTEDFSLEPKPKKKIKNLSKLSVKTNKKILQDCFFYSLMYDPTQMTLLADKGCIKVGEKYQVITWRSFRDTINSCFQAMQNSLVIQFSCKKLLLAKFKFHWPSLVSITGWVQLEPSFKVKQTNILI